MLYFFDADSREEIQKASQMKFLYKKTDSHFFFFIERTKKNKNIRE